jgi:mono/diheme cytochrome c family protein
MKIVFFASSALLFAACRRPESASSHAQANAPASPPSASAASAPVAQETPQPQPAASAVAAVPSADGEQLFQKNCAQCHMANGSGVPYLQPDIRHSAWISAENPQLLLSLILRGSVVLGEGAKAYENDMPPFEHLSDAEIAALATRVRQKFGTPPPARPVTPADVATARARPGLPE